jgi:magnesium chelatase subunit D
MSKAKSSSYPFAAVVGRDEAKRALLMLAVDPCLKGVLIAHGPSSAKSTLARSLGPLLGPDKPFVELPLNVSEERLLGGIDLEKSIKTGRSEYSPGLLHRASGGLLYVDEANLLDRTLAGHIAAALDEGFIRMEREGLSATTAASFIFVGTYNPAEGKVGMILSDRVGLIVEGEQESAVDERAEIVSRAIRFQQDSSGFNEEFAADNAGLRAAIESARGRLPGISVPAEAIRRLALAALALGVEGNRADLFAARAARACAALDGRDALNEDDLIAAIKLVLLPRATRIPAPDEETGAEDASNEDDQHIREASESDAPRDDKSPALEELVIQAVDSHVSGDLFHVAKNRGRSTSGRRAETKDASRGRYVRSTSRKQGGSRIALDATLRAAAPFQLSRRGRGDPNDKRAKITKSDLRYKKFKRRSGILFIFAVDASGSMALNRMAQAKGALTRLLHQAYLHRDKVALISFRASEAKVLLPPTRSVEIAKRLVDAMPTGGATPMAAGLLKAMELARRSRTLETSQVMLALITDGRANVGLGNSPLEERRARASTIQDEIKQIGVALEAEGVSTVVIDTRSRFVSSGDAGALAASLAAQYLYLPRADSSTIYEAVTSIAGRMRAKRES